jgi:hypothetical protein
MLGISGAIGRTFGFMCLWGLSKGCRVCPLPSYAHIAMWLCNTQIVKDMKGVDLVT